MYIFDKHQFKECRSTSMMGIEHKGYRHEFSSSAGLIYLMHAENIKISVTFNLTDILHHIYLF